MRLGKPAISFYAARIPAILLDFAEFQRSALMATNSIRSPIATPSSASNRGLRWFGVFLGLVFPMIITWGYFILADRYSTSVQQTTYLVVKIIQFAFPLVWVLLVLRESPQLRRPNASGLILGAGFSLAVVGAGWLLFDLILRDTPVFAAAAPRIHEKIAEFGIDSLWKYAALGLFYSLIHSLLEEYYWRWFVFRQLRSLVPLWPAIVVSALAFMGHHVILLSEFFKEAPWLAWLLSSAVAVGGAFWAWLYERTGSIYSAWLSHLLIDAGIFWVGYELVRDALLNGPAI
jgi:membrane protease YdiL (CAAX protease family)